MRQRRADKARRRRTTGPATAVLARIRMAETILKQERQAFDSLVKQKKAFYDSLRLELDKVLAEEERLLTERRNPP